MKNFDPEYTPSGTKRGIIFMSVTTISLFLLEKILIFFQSKK